MLANNSRPVPTHSSAEGAPPGRGARGELVGRDVDGQRSGVGVEGDDVAVAHARQRSAGGRLGGEMDCGRDLSGRAGHAAVGDQRHPVAAVLQHAQSRGELVQFGHAEALRPLVTQHRDEIAVQRAGFECVQELLLAVEHHGRRGDRPVLADRRPTS